MGQMWGADADELERTASRMQAGADQLERIAHRLNAQLHATRWPTPQGDRFRSDWNRRHLRGMNDTVRHLREGADALRRNARQQREASGQIAGHSSPLARWRHGNLFSQLGDIGRWVHDAGRKALEDLRHGSSDALQAFWSGLSPAQRRAIGLLAPGLVLALPIVPQDVREAALGTVDDELAGDVVTYQEEITVDVEGKVPLEVVNVVFGAGGSAKITGHPDGKYEVELSVDGRIGVSEDLPKTMSIEGTVGGRATQTYEFDSREEAERFVAGLVKAAAPVDGNDVPLLAAAVLTPLGRDLLRDDMVKDAAAYLHGFRNELKHNELAVETGGKFSIGDGPAALEVSATRSVSYDTVDESITVSGEVAASGNLGPIGGEGSIKGSYTVAPDGTPQSLTLEIHAAGTADVFRNGELFASPGAPVELVSGAGGAADIKVTLDLTKGTNLLATRDFISAFSRGDPSAMQHLGTVMDHSAVVVQTSVQESAHAGFDVEVAKASLDAKISAPTNTWVRPADGSWTRIDTRLTPVGGGSGW